MQGGHRAARHRPEQRHLELVDMEMDDVELLRSLGHPTHHQHEIRYGVANSAVKPQRYGSARREFGGGHRIATGEQRYSMSEANKFLRKVGYDPFGSAIESRRNTLEQRCDLRYSHFAFLPACSPGLNEKTHDS